MKPSEAKLLLVDDDRNLLEPLGLYLQSEFKKVFEAFTGPDALRVAYREHPNLVVLDVMMPGMDGWEVAARLREMSDLAIIMLTGKSTEADKLRGFNLGVDDYLTKPFSFAELSARIQAILSRLQPQGNENTNQLVFGKLTVDLDKRLVRRNSEIIPLTPTEFRLLEYLLQRKGHAISEAELSQAVWGHYRAEDTTMVRRYIWLLRQKVEEDPAHPVLILTLRGYGYRLGTGLLRGSELPEA